MPVPPPRRAALRRRLLAWYDAGHRDLPWRFAQRAADPYRVWLAEVMLQQTQVQAVIPYYGRFLARFPTLEALAAAREEEVLALWSGLGYYARGRNLLAAARAARARHGGLPASLAALAALPGFGRYTAGAVASIAFAIPAAALDGNVARVLARLFLVEGDPATPAVRERLWAIAEAIVDPERPGDLNQALMELGATHCRKPAPRCGPCPVSRLCGARAAGRQRELPAARARPIRRELELACLLVTRGDEVLVLRRPPSGLFGGLLGPPVAEVAAGVAPGEALARACSQALPQLGVGAELGTVVRTLTHRELTLRVFRGTIAPRARPGGEGIRWLAPGDAAKAGVPVAFRAVFAKFFSPRAADPGRTRPVRGAARPGVSGSGARDRTTA